MAKPRKRIRKGSAQKTIATTTRRKSGAEVVDEHEDVEKEPVDIADLQNPAHVRVTGSITKNMGDYNSLHVGIQIEMPCAPTEEGVEEAYVWCSEKVEEKIAEEMELAGMNDK